jgi:predicted DNA-binding transcriptional regulator AlpA
MSDRILSIDEAAQVTPFSKSSLYRIAAQGTDDSPFRKRRGRWIVVESDLLAWARSGERPKKREHHSESPMPRPRARRRGSVLATVHELRRQGA